jgi:hypothetical protein
LNSNKNGTNFLKEKYWDIESACEKPLRPYCIDVLLIIIIHYYYYYYYYYILAYWGDQQRFYSAHPRIGPEIRYWTWGTLLHFW